MGWLAADPFERLVRTVRNKISIERVQTQTNLTSDDVPSDRQPNSEDSGSTCQPHFFHQLSLTSTAPLRLGALQSLF